jgi:hypothetical protein
MHHSLLFLIVDTLEYPVRAADLDDAIITIGHAHACGKIVQRLHN